MKTTKKVVRPNLAYFGITQVTDNSLVPDGMYFIEREREGTWLMSLKQKTQEEAVSIGTLDLQDIMCVANKSHLANLSRDEFYEILEKFFKIDFIGKLYATKDIKNVFSRVASYSKQMAI